MESKYQAVIIKRKFGTWYCSDNELIAQFMDLQCDVVNDVKIWYKMGSVSQGELRYDTSWDWLMPVVEKIEDKLSEKGASKVVGWDYWNNVFDGYVNTDINVTYESVTGFIKWYNQQTPKP